MCQFFIALAKEITYKLPWNKYPPIDTIYFTRNSGATLQVFPPTRSWPGIFTTCDTENTMTYTLDGEVFVVFFSSNAESDSTFDLSWQSKFY